MRKRTNKPYFKAGKHVKGSSRRQFISSILSFSLLGLTLPFLESDKIYAEENCPEYLFVNGWLIRNDDYEMI